MIFRILLLLLPLILYLLWMWSRSRKVKKGKAVRVIPVVWQRVILALVILSTLLLLYVGLYFNQQKDESFAPFRPETFQEQTTTR